MESNKHDKTNLRGVSQYAIDTYGFTSEDKSYLERGKQHVVVTAKDGTRNHYQEIGRGEYEIVKIEEGHGKKRVTTNFRRENVLSQTEGKEKRTKTQVEVLGANNLNAFYGKEKVKSSSEKNRNKKDMEQPKKQKNESNKKNLNSDELRILELEKIMRATENSDEQAYLAAESERKKINLNVDHLVNKKSTENVKRQIENVLSAIEIAKTDEEKVELEKEKELLERKLETLNLIGKQEDVLDKRIQEADEQGDKEAATSNSNIKKGLEKVSESLSEEDEVMAKELEAEIDGQYTAQSSGESLNNKNQDPMAAWIERNNDSAESKGSQKETKVNTQEISVEMKKLENTAKEKFQKMNEVIREVKKREGDNYVKGSGYPEIEQAKAEYNKATKAVAEFEAANKDILDTTPDQKEILENKTSEERKAYEKAFEAKQTAQHGVVENNNTGEKYIHIDQGKLFNLRRKERMGDISDAEKTELETLNAADASSRARYNELRELDAEGKLSEENKNWLNAIVAHRNVSAASLNEIRDSYMNPSESENETLNEDHLTSEEREKNEQIRAERAANPDRDKKYDESKKLESSDTKRSNKHLGILETRRKNLITKEAELKNKKKLVKRLANGELDSMSTEDAALGEQILSSLQGSDKELSDYKKDLENEGAELRVKIGNLDHRITKTERQLSKYNNRNENWLKKNLSSKLALSGKQLKRWWQNPDNKKKFIRRVAVSTAVTAGLTIFAPAAALGATATMAGRFGLSYGLGEGARTLYNKSLRKEKKNLGALEGERGKTKDYRQRMWDQRKNRIPIEAEEGQENKAIKIPQEKMKEWKEYQENLEKRKNKIIKKQNRYRMVWDTTGRVIGGFSARGIMDSLTPDIPSLPETTPDIPVEPKPPEVIESFISKDIFIHSSPTSPTGVDEGITHAFKRQLESNEELRKALNIEGNVTKTDLADLAKRFGYISEDGSDVRVWGGKGAGYELKLVDGKVQLFEHKGGHIEGNNYIGGETVEVKSVDTVSFEGNNIEKIGSPKGEYEYLENRVKKAIDNNGLKIDPNNTLNPDTGFNLDDAGVIKTKIETNSFIIPGRNYPGHRFVPNGMFDAKFNNMHTDRSVMELFNTNGLQFSQKNFEMLGWRMAPNGNGAAEFINENDVGSNKGRLYTWKDIYEQTDFSNMKTRYPNLDFSNPTNTTGRTGFNLDNAGTIKDAAPQIKETFAQNTGHFKITHFNQGNPKISYDPNFRFTGEMETGDFSVREERFLKKGKFDLLEGMPAQGRIPELGLNNAGIIKLKNGQYVFQNIVATPDKASGLSLGSKQMDTAMRMLGMPNHVEHAIPDDKPIPGSNLYRTRVFTPISEEQAKYIGKIYTEMRRFTGMNNPK